MSARVLLNALFCWIPFFVATHSMVLSDDNREGYSNRPGERNINAITDSLPRHDLVERQADFKDENIIYRGEQVAEKIRNNLFVLAEVSKAECFVGEPLIVTYKLYSRLNASSSITGQPALNGFSKSEFISHVSLSKSTELLRGKQFQVHILRKTKLIPLIAGSLEIDAMEVQHKVNFIKSIDDTAASGNQLSDLLGQMKRAEESSSSFVTIKTLSRRLVVTVKDLPESNRPISVSGAVGSFTISARILTQKLIAHENMTLVIQIKGRGHLSLIEPLAVKFPDGIEFFNVKSIMTPEIMSGEFTTGRTFEYLGVPRKAGLTKIPAVSFSYFDLVTKSYKTIQTMPIHLEVLENPKKSTAKVISISKPATIGKLHSRSRLTRVIPAFMLILIIAGSIAIFSKSIYKFLRKSIASITRRSAGKNVKPTADKAILRATSRLQPVREMLEKRDFSVCYYELNKTLWCVITEKLNLIPTELSKGNIFAELGMRGWTPEDKWSLELIMNEYERNLYVPGYQDEHDYEAAYNKALHMIAKLDELN